MAHGATSASFEEHVASVLVVSSSGKIDETLLSMLPASRFSPVKFVSSVSAAKRAWGVRDYDYVVVSSPLPDDAGIRFAIDVCNARRTVVMLLVSSDIFSDVQAKVSGFGVFVLPKPTSKPLLALALAWMESAHCRLGRLEERAHSLEEKMAEIRLVNRAKLLLVANLGMDEPAAHRYIEKQAMDRCITRRQVAEEIVEGR